MFVALQVVTVMVVAVAMALVVAHVLELPGKMRLSKEEYLAVQPIYYPGFTIGGIAEPLGLVLLLGLAIAMPIGSAMFWLTTGAFLALAAMHATYWLLTHPVNNFWLKDAKLTRASAAFFSFGMPAQRDESASPPWTHLRDQWEFSHIVRAVLGILSLILLVTAIAM